MKTQTFHMRMSVNTREMLEQLAQHYNIPLTSMVDMLICEKYRTVVQGGGFCGKKEDV